MAMRLNLTPRCFGWLLACSFSGLFYTLLWRVL